MAIDVGWQSGLAPLGAVHFALQEFNRGETERNLPFSQFQVSLVTAPAFEGGQPMALILAFA